MKFRVNIRPQLGDTRTVTKFAWLPRRVGKGTYIVWLEKYLSIQQFDETLEYVGNGMACSECKVNKWVEKRTSLRDPNNPYAIITNR